MLSLASSQALFELGLGQVLLVFFSRYFLTSNRSQLQLLYQTSSFIYRLIAFCYFLIGGLFGYFLLNTSGSLVRQLWLPPWLFLCFLISLNFIYNKKLTFIESTGRESSVFAIRSVQYLVGSLIYLLCLTLDLGLWSVCSIPFSCVLVSHFWINSRHISSLFSFPPHNYSISEYFSFWSKTLLPLQFRTSISFLCGFIGLQLFLPLVFYFYGADAAGRVGLALNIMVGITLISTSFSTANARRFALLASNNSVNKLFRLFFHSIIFTLLTSFTGLLFAVICFNYFPIFQALTLDFNLFLILSCSCIANSLIYCFAIFLRSYLREPFVVPSLLGSLTTFFLFLIVNSSNLSQFVLAYTMGSLISLIFCSRITYLHYIVHRQL